MRRRIFCASTLEGKMAVRKLNTEALAWWHVAALAAKRRQPNVGLCHEIDTLLNLDRITQDLHTKMDDRIHRYMNDMNEEHSYGTGYSAYLLTYEERWGGMKSTDVRPLAASFLALECEDEAASVS